MDQSFAARIDRHPTPHDPAAAADARTGFAGLPGPVLDLIGGVAACSPYLRGLMAVESDWLRQVIDHAPESTLTTLLDSLTATPTDLLASTLRQSKRRVALLTALCDCGGVWGLAQITGALTALADRAVHLALTRLVGDEIRRGKLPGATPDDADTAGGLVALAMGKMGAGDLNYSSDIDLICLFDQDRYGADWSEARAVFIRVVRKMTALLSEITAEGYVFRTDLRLRPDASVMPVCLSMAAAEAYYEAEGRTWERAAYIKARPCGGDLAAGSRFLATLTPFVWRRHLDYAAIQDAHDMRLRIRDHRGLNGPLAVEGHNLKLGQGGIREIEFFTQTRQLIAGGRDPDLRDRGTLAALQALSAKAWVPAEVTATLTKDYTAHRTLEHRLQMVNDAQTHDLPTSPEGVARIAAFMGQDEPAFRRDLLDRLERVDRLTTGFFSPPLTDTAPDLSDHAKSIVARWSSFPALRSDRAQAIFRRLQPGLLKRLSRAANPDEALLALDGFLAGLPAGVQVFALFEANPILIDLIIDIAGTAPALARHLARNAAVLDAVIGGSFFAPWPGMAALRDELAKRLVAAADYEKRLDTARLWQREWHFRIGVHHLRGLIDGFEAAKSYADLAEAVIAALWPHVVAAISAKHGPPPGRGAVVLGMGSLGAARLNAASDLDLIVIYDAGGADASAGPRPLATRPYYARLTQALVTALTAPMASGRLYEVDMRLRPSGRQGPVATALSAFREYQEADAWTWEHLALTRARVLAGDAGLADEVEAFRRDLMAAKSRNPALRRDTADMRARLAQHRPGGSAWEAKLGPGGLMDIELFAQMLALTTASPARSVERQLAAGAKAAIVSETDAQALLSAYRLCWSLQAATRLLSDRVLDPAQLGEGARAFVLRETAQDDVAALTARLRDGTEAAGRVITANLRGATDAID